MSTQYSIYENGKMHGGFIKVDFKKSNTTKDKKLIVNKNDCSKFKSKLLAKFLVWLLNNLAEIENNKVSYKIITLINK